MDAFELIEGRFSVREYRPDPVEEEKLQQVLEAARLAPTAANLAVYLSLRKCAGLRPVVRGMTFCALQGPVCGTSAASG